MLYADFGETVDERYSVGNTYVSKLEEKHKSILVQFTSSEEDQNNFLHNDALEYTKLNLGVTYLLFRQADDKLIAFTTLGTGAIRIPDKLEWELHGKKLKDYPKMFPNQFPALKIGQIATITEEEGKGAGTLLLHFASKLATELKSRVGCTYLVLDARSKRIDWYKKRGFKTWITNISGMETVPMYTEIQ